LVVKNSSRAVNSLATRLVRRFNRPINDVLDLQMGGNIRAARAFEHNIVSQLEELLLHDCHLAPPEKTIRTPPQTGNPHFFSVATEVYQILRNSIIKVRFPINPPSNLTNFEGFSHSIHSTRQYEQLMVSLRSIKMADYGLTY
jgi:hypothetical protein